MDYFILTKEGASFDNGMLKQLQLGNEGWQPQENLKVVSELVCGEDPQEAFESSIDKIKETVESIKEKQNKKAEGKIN